MNTAADSDEADYLILKGDDLWCTYCDQLLADDTAAIATHIRSAEHKAFKNIREDRNQRKLAELAAEAREEERLLQEQARLKAELAAKA